MYCLASFLLLPRLKSLMEALPSSGPEKEEREKYLSPSSLFWRGIHRSITFTPRICLAAGVSGSGCCGPWFFWVAPTGLLTRPALLLLLFPNCWVFPFLCHNHDTRAAPVVWSSVTPSPGGAMGLWMRGP